MIDPVPLYYESHVTIDPVFEQIRLDTLMPIIGKHGFRLAKLFMAKGEPSKLDTFVSSRGVTFDDLKARMTGVANDLQLAGFVVQRCKIEAVLEDVRP